MRLWPRAQLGTSGEVLNDSVISAIQRSAWARASASVYSLFNSLMDKIGHKHFMGFHVRDGNDRAVNGYCDFAKGAG
jgi:hypothetical protein